MKVLSLKAIKLIFKVVAALCLIGVAAGAVALWRSSAYSLLAGAPRVYTVPLLAIFGSDRRGSENSCRIGEA
jgi:hypothetical protein